MTDKHYVSISHVETRVSVVYEITYAHDRVPTHVEGNGNVYVDSDRIIQDVRNNVPSLSLAANYEVNTPAALAHSDSNERTYAVRFVKVLPGAGQWATS